MPISSTNTLPRAILFDLDDTILSAYGRPLAAWRKIADEFAAMLFPLTPEDCAAAIEAQSQLLWNDPAWNRQWRLQMPEARRLIVAGAFAALATGGKTVPQPSLGQIMADRFTLMREAELQLFPGAHETLDRLKQRGVRLALITNGAAEAQRAKVVRFALQERFDHIQIEGEHGFGKPEERAYTHAMAALGVAAQETWMVGDNLEWEIAAPQRLGIYAIWHDPHAAGLPPDCAVRPDRVIRSLPELLG
jgi:putative hydrolase of the HAD superfamily